ncbi:MAG: protein kinase domain-containing protein [Planctomycetota bacterium]|jgi:tetratricopeptide (TPR) repeat protein
MEPNGENQGDTTPQDPDIPPTLDPESARSDPRGSGESPSPGKRIGPYEILGEIGRGGMGIVFKAFQPALKRTVALKVLIAGEDASEEAITRFHREAEAVAKLGHHPHIVPIYDIGQDGRNHYFAMHYVEGISLDRLIDDGEITPNRAAVITQKLAEALHHAHQHGILHRDVKPANVLMAHRQLSREPETRDSKLETSEWEPCLTDFGLAKDVASESKMTRSGMTLGTPQYMPPEQAKGDLEAVDERSDVYSLGAALYEMLTLRPPFEGNNVMEVINRVLFKEPASPCRGNPAIDRDLETICLKCLEKDPNRRYRSAGLLAEDLGRFLAGSPILAKPASGIVKTMRWFTRHRLGAAIGICILVLVAVGAVSAYIVAGKERAREKEKARADEEKSEREKTDQLLAKTKTVSEVLLSAHSRLGRAHDALLKVFFDSTRSEKDRRDVYDRYTREIERFCTSASTGPASTATAEAVKGWLLCLGAREREAKDLFRKARETDEGVAWGYLFEGMTLWSVYLRLQELPGYGITGSGEIVFRPLPGESETMKSIGRRLDTLLKAARERCPDDEGSVGVFQEAISGFRAVQRGDPAKAEEALTRALDHWAFAWMTDTILFTRSRLRFHIPDLAGCEEDLRSLVDAFPKYAPFHHSLGHLWIATALERERAFEDPVPFLDLAVKACEESTRLEPSFKPANNQNTAAALGRKAYQISSRGGDPRPIYRKAIRLLTENMELLKPSGKSYSQRGELKSMMGQACLTLGEDSLPWFKAALEDLNEAVRIDPESPLFYQTRGQIHRFIGDALIGQREKTLDAYHLALADLSRAIRLEPRDPSTYYMRATCLWKIGNQRKANGLDPEPSYRKAIEDCNASLQRSPNGARALKNRAIARSNLGRWLFWRGKDPEDVFRKGVADCTAAVKADPKHGETLVVQGRLLNDLGILLGNRGEDSREWHRRSVEVCDRALSLNENDHPARVCRSQAWKQLGVAQRSRGEDPGESFRQAIEDAEKVLAQRPRHVDALRALGEAHLEKGRWASSRGMNPQASFEEALRVLEAGLREDPYDPDLYTSRFRTLEAWVFDPASTADPGQIWRKILTNFDEAEKRFPLIDALWRHRGTARLNLANVLDARGTPDPALEKRAIKDGEKALSLNPDSPLNLDFLGQAHAHMGRSLHEAGEDPGDAYRTAIRLFGEALRRKPDQLESLVHRGSTWLSQGLAEKKKGRDPSEAFRQAKSNADDVLRKKPDNSDALLLRGRVWVNMAHHQIDRGEDPDPALREALRDLNKVLKGKKNRKGALVNRASAYFWMGFSGGADPARAKGNLEKAVEDCGKALALSPNDVSALDWRALAFLRLGRLVRGLGEDPRAYYKKGIEDLTKLLKVNFRPEVTLSNRGAAYSWLAGAERILGGDPAGLNSKAIEDLEKAATFKSGSEALFRNLGAAYEERGNAVKAEGEDPRPWYRKALRHFGKALAVNPRSIQSLKARGALHCILADAELARKEGDPAALIEQGIADLETANRLSPGMLVSQKNLCAAWYRLGTLKKEKGEDPWEAFAKSLEVGDKYLKAFPKNHDLRFTLGHVYALVGNAKEEQGGDPKPYHKRALALFRESLSHAPGRLSTLLGLARSLVKLDRIREGVEVYTRILDRDDSLQGSGLKVGVELLALGEFDLASRCAKALQGDEAWKDRGDYLMAALMDLRGNPKDAFTHFESCSKRGELVPYALFHMLRLHRLWGQGDRKKIVEAFERLDEEETSTVPAKYFPRLAGLEPGPREAKDTEAAFCLGICLLAEGKKEEAAKAFDKALEEKDATFTGVFAKAEKERMR